MWKKIIELLKARLSPEDRRGVNPSGSECDCELCSREREQQDLESMLLEIEQQVEMLEARIDRELELQELSQADNYYLSQALGEIVIERNLDGIVQQLSPSSLGHLILGFETESTPKELYISLAIDLICLGLNPPLLADEKQVIDCLVSSYSNKWEFVNMLEYCGCDSTQLIGAALLLGEFRSIHGVTPTFEGLKLFNHIHRVLSRFPRVPEHWLREIAHISTMTLN